MVTLVAAEAVRAAVPVIMPLGDSITDGFVTSPDERGGYRIKLYPDLGGQVNFVGTQSNGPSTLADKDHEGHSGYKIADVTLSLNGNPSSVAYGSGQPNTGNGGYWLTGNNGAIRPAVTPNLFLLTIGTNDIIHENTTQDPSNPVAGSGGAVSGMTGRLDALLTAIHDLRPDATILLSSIPPTTRGTFNSTVIAYNSAIKNGVVPAHAANGEKVTFVDQYPNFIGTDGNIINLVDGVHPTLAGYGLMGDTWAAAIQQAQAPEPSAAILLGTAGIMALGRRRRVK